MDRSRISCRSRTSMKAGGNKATAADAVTTTTTTTKTDHPNPHHRHCCHHSNRSLHHHKHTSGWCKLLQAAEPSTQPSPRHMRKHHAHNHTQGNSILNHQAERVFSLPINHTVTVHQGECDGGGGGRGGGQNAVYQSSCTGPMQGVYTAAPAYPCFL